MEIKAPKASDQMKEDSLYRKYVSIYNQDKQKEAGPEMDTVEIIGPGYFFGFEETLY